MLLTTPNQLRLEFTQGDSTTLTFQCTDDQGNPVDIAGAALSTQIRGANGVGSVTFPNAQHTVLNQSSFLGQFSLALATTDTANCGEGAHKEVITTVTLAGQVTNFRGVNLLTVYNPVPTQ